MAAMLFLLSLCIIGSQGNNFCRWALFRSITYYFSIAACTNPKVDFQSYSSSNALLSRENALIVEVQLSCEEVGCMIDGLTWDFQFWQCTLYNSYI